MKKFNRRGGFEKSETPKFRLKDNKRGPKRFDRRDDDEGSKRFGRRDDDRAPRRFARDSGRDSGRFDRQERRPGFQEKFTVTCDRCGKRCEVPFKPTNTKPVYCSDCFRKEGGSDSRRSGGSRDEFEQINRKLDKIMKTMGID